jgi:hypothetical protein
MEEGRKEVKEGRISRNLLHFLTSFPPKDGDWFCISAKYR